MTMQRKHKSNQRRQKWMHPKTNINLRHILDNQKKNIAAFRVEIFRKKEKICIKK